jgi:hypothetical protein
LTFFFFLKFSIKFADKAIGGTQMDIQGYQIHNVLNVFRRQLSQGAFDQSRHVSPRLSDMDPVTISTKQKKQSVMEKVAATVFKKITNVAPGSEINVPTDNPVKQVDKGSQGLKEDGAFIYHAIVGNNRKVTRSIAINDSQGLMNQLDELAKAAVNRSADRTGGKTDQKLEAQKGRYHQGR